MDRIISILFLFSIALFTHKNCLAQQPFKEGRIIYAVTMEPASNQEGLVQYNGLYTITIKDKKLHTELKMDNGFTNVMIIDEGKQEAYTLKEMQGKKYAIQLDAEKLANRSDKYLGYSLKEKGSSSDVAGLKTHKGVIRYKDGTSNELIYSKELVPDVLIFEYFPQLNALPLEFTWNNMDGIQHFNAREVISEPIENTYFRIPQQYKIVSSNEYRQMLK